MRTAGLFALALGLGCATGDTPGFTGGNASFGSGSASASASGTADDGDGDGDGDGADDGVMTGGADSDTGIDPSGVDSGGNDDPTADTGVADTGNPDGPACVPSDEICDGDDNDCNGMVDDGDPGAGDPCATGLMGPCGEGVTACQGGEIVCVQVTTPEAESCDGVDNDCNGQADDGDPEGGAACMTGQPGICAAGTSACENGGVVCNQNQQSTTEACNNLDDDCDGTPDDGNPGGGGVCNTGQPGICAAGTLQCQAGVVNCVQNQTSQAEICGNGIDEDCDGTPDDGCGCAHPLCSTGTALVSGCDPCATSICAVDSFCCTNSWDSICVNEVGSVCGQVCQGSCAHSPCVTGTLLVSGCAYCVDQVCAADAFCCSNSWDSLCVTQVSSVCGLTC